MTTPELPDLTGRLMVSCSRFTRVVRQRTAGDHSIAEWRALAILAEHDGLRVTDFARADQLTQPTATAAVNRLTAAGLAERVPDPSDGRASLVRLTATGHRRLGELRRVGSERLAPLLAPLSADELDVLTRAADLLARISTTPSGATAAHPVPTTEHREDPTA